MEIMEFIPCMSVCFHPQNRLKRAPEEQAAISNNSSAGMMACYGNKGNVNVKDDVKVEGSNVFHSHPPVTTTIITPLLGYNVKTASSTPGDDKSKLAATIILQKYPKFRDNSPKSLAVLAKMKDRYH